MSQEEKIRELLETRKWTDFLEAIPNDGVSRSFPVRNPNDLMVIRVRASQLKKPGRKYKTEIDFGKSKISIAVYNETEQNNA